MSWLALVALPPGSCKDPEDRCLDFDRIYLELLQPALEAAGFVVTRLQDAGDDGDDRSLGQALSAAELVVADLSLDSGWIGRLLGLCEGRHEGGLIRVHASTVTTPSRSASGPRLAYRLQDGVPDPHQLAEDRAALTRLALGSLSTPPRRSPCSGDSRACPRQIAAGSRPGDLLVLAGEAPNRRLRIAGLLAAGDALAGRGQQAFALEQFEAALALDPSDRPGREKRARSLSRLQRSADARAAVQELLRDATDDDDDDDEAGCRELLGDVEQQAWVEHWRIPGSAPEPLRERARDSAGPLDAAIGAYHGAFLADPRRFEAGSKALSLLKLRERLGRDPDPEATERLLGGLHWSCHRAREREPGNLRARFRHAELSLLTQAREILLREFRGAISAAAHDRVALEAARESLGLLRDLGLRPQETATVLAMIEREIAHAPARFEPRRVFLFSGHMVDTPERPTPRFPASMVPAAARRIAEALDLLGAGDQDLALSQAAAGGDLLFLESCRQRGLRCEVLLPFAEAEFIQRSILPSTGGQQWRERLEALRPQLQIRDAPQELEPRPVGVDPYERCNLWLLYTALSWGVERLRFVTLWNGGGGDAPGGTAHMVGEVQRRSGRVTWIDLRTLEAPYDTG